MKITPENCRNALFCFVVLSFAALSGLSQTAALRDAARNTNNSGVAASPAFAEILLRKTDLESELESLILDYTEDFPRVKEIRFSIDVLERDILRLNVVKQGETGKLTVALGKLMVRRMEFETELWKLRQTYKDEHPDVKRAMRRVEIYEKAIKRILG